MVAAENDAIVGAKVGGMADVVRDVPPALANLGHEVSVIIPDYAHYDQVYNSTVVASFTVPFAGKLEQVSLHELNLGESEFRAEKHHSGKVRQLVLSHPIFTAQGIGRVYLDDPSDRPFAGDATKYALFNAAVLEALLHDYLPRPDVLHLHDWHSALTSVLLKYSDRYQSLNEIHSVYTIHNLALQGIRPLSGDESSLEAWFGSLSYDGQAICDPRYPNCINPMRAAINLANKVHLVSPSYAQEVLQVSNASQGIYGGEGLELDLINADNRGKLFGILNGCVYHDEIDCKQAERPELSERLLNILTPAIPELATWIAGTEQLTSSHYLANERVKSWLNSHKFTGPLVTSVGRLTDQKMLLLRKPVGISSDESNAINALPLMLTDLAKVNGCMIILGSGDPTISTEFTQLMAQHDNFLFLNGYGQSLTDALYEFGDLFLMPSSFEPCGISQMLALRAGQPCLVHSVGGLKDTVKHRENGFCFAGDSIGAQQQQMIGVFNQAINLFVDDKKTWQGVVAYAKQSRFSWQESVTKYVSDLYH